jgi:uncharacterized protein (TIGR02231 family)
MPRALCLVALFIGLLSLAAVAAEKAAPPSVAGRVVEVTLYRGQALVTRLVPLDGAKGLVELSVGPLPEQILPESLFAESDEGLEIRAVRYRAQAVGDEPREEVRRLDETIDSLTDQLRAVERQAQVLAKQNAYLDQMESFVLPTMKTDLARGFLDAAALEKLTQLAFSQREAAAKRAGEIELKTKDLRKQLALAQKQRAELTGSARREIREAVLFLEKRDDAKHSVRVGYLVGNCGWSPAYTFRAAGEGKHVAVECNAIITQTTGEDWSDVKLTLSTASPALSAAGPGLGPFPIALSPLGQAVRYGEREVADRLRDIRGRKAEAIQQGRNVVALNEAISSSFSANSAANDYQALELAVGREMLGAAAGAGDAEGPSLSYRPAAPVSLASRSDQQMVRIMRADFPAAFYHVATPVLTGLVYREAELVNQGADDLLAGPIAVYLDGRFVGRGEIPTVARGQTFVVGFGADPQLRAKRELVERNEVMQGGNRELSFKYRLVLENFSEKPAQVRLFDRAPYSDRPTEVRIKLGEMKDALSKDPLYLRTERPKNILRWDIEVAGAAAGEKARLVEYGLTIEFDRQLTINLPGARPNDPATAAPSPASEMYKIEFEQMQRAKMAH